MAAAACRPRRFAADARPVALAQSGVSVSLGACLRDGRPITGLGVGCRVGPAATLRLLLRHAANASRLDARYGATISDTARRAGLVCAACRTIPFPGLAAPRSQIAVPITEAGRVLGVLFAEADEMMRRTPQRRASADAAPSVRADGSTASARAMSTSSLPAMRRRLCSIRLR